MSTLREYTVETGDLPALVQACPWDAKHTALLRLIRAQPGFESARLVLAVGLDEGMRLTRRRVMNSQGEVIHDDHQAWLTNQWEQHDRDATATLKSLSAGGYRLTEIGVSNLYFMVDRGGSSSNFLQLEVDCLVERLDCIITDDGFLPARELSDLIHEIGSHPLLEVEQLPVGTPSYMFRTCTDMDLFVALAQRIELDQRRRNEQRIPRTAGTPLHASLARAHQASSLYPCKSKRLFDDWDASSAGQSGQRICDHWVMKTSDWTDPGTQQRYVSLIPRWTFIQRLAEVNAQTGDEYTFYGKLQTLDRRVSVPFGWYFFMLHGNRVTDASAYRAIDEAEKGHIVMPEQDYQVLRRWRSQPYGF